MDLHLPPSGASEIPDEAAFEKNHLPTHADAEVDNRHAGRRSAGHSFPAADGGRSHAGVGGGGRALSLDESLMLATVLSVGADLFNG